MNRFEEFQARVNDRSKSVFGYTVDWIEWSAKKNLSIAEDVTQFAVSQLRLPAEAGDFADYRHSVRDAYGEFGGVLKHHGEDYVARLKDVPAEVRDLLAPRKPVKKAAPKPKAAKPKAAKPKAAKPKAAASKKAKATPATAATTV